MRIYREFRFEAAHRLPLVPDGHKCRRLHGHSFRCEVHVSAPVGAMGWVMDFAEIQAAVGPVIERLDHHYLNEVPGLENPTSEHLARWLWDEIKPGLPALCRILVSETCHSGCVYEGEP